MLSQPERQAAVRQVVVREGRFISSCPSTDLAQPSASQRLTTNVVWMMGPGMIIILGIGEDEEEE